MPSSLHTKIAPPSPFSVWQFSNVEPYTVTLPKLLLLKYFIAPPLMYPSLSLPPIQSLKLQPITVNISAV